MEHLENGGGRVWAARTRAVMGWWLGWLGALLQLNYKGRYLCGLPNTGERMLLTEMGAEAQTGHNDTVGQGGQSRRYFFIVTSNDNAYL